MADDVTLSTEMQIFALIFNVRCCVAPEFYFVFCITESSLSKVEQMFERNSMRVTSVPLVTVDLLAERRTVPV